MKPLLAEGLFEANRIVVGIALGIIAVVTMLYLLRRWWHR